MPLRCCGTTADTGFDAFVDLVAPIEFDAITGSNASIGQDHSVNNSAIWETLSTVYFDHRPVLVSVVSLPAD